MAAIATNDFTYAGRERKLGFGPFRQTRERDDG
jgi:hypothetical protein